MIMKVTDVVTKIDLGGKTFVNATGDVLYLRAIGGFIIKFMPSHSARVITKITEFVQGESEWFQLAKHTSKKLSRVPEDKGKDVILVLKERDFLDIERVDIACPECPIERCEILEDGSRIEVTTISGFRVKEEF